MSKNVIVSNRLPVQVAKINNSFEFRPSTGGLATGLDSIHKNTDSLWIGWSGISRKEFFVNDIGWHTITPTAIGKDDLITAYYAYLQSVQQDNLNFYYQTLLLQMWLEKKNVKYFMFRHDDGQTKQMIKDGSRREVVDGYDTTHITQEQVKDINLKTFPSYTDNELTFREYILKNGGGLKPQRHPDEKSHGLFAEYLYQNLKGK